MDTTHSTGDTTRAAGRWRGAFAKRLSGSDVQVIGPTSETRIWSSAIAHGRTAADHSAWRT